MSSGTRTPDPGITTVTPKGPLRRRVADKLFKGIKKFFRRGDRVIGNLPTTASLTDFTRGQNNGDTPQSGIGQRSGMGHLENFSAPVIPGISPQITPAHVLAPIEHVISPAVLHDEDSVDLIASTTTGLGLQAHVLTGGNPTIEQDVFVAPAQPQPIMSSDPAQSPPSDTGNNIKETLSMTGRFIKTLFQKLPDVVDGNPVKMAFSIAKLIIETKDAYTNNKDTLHKNILDAADRLSVVETATGYGACLPKSAEVAIDRFAAELLDTLVKLLELEEGSRLTQILDYKHYSEAIAQYFMEIGRATERFQLAMAIEIQKAAGRIEEGMKRQSLLSLKPSTSALYNAQISGKSLKREACTEGTRTNILMKIDHWVDEASHNTVFWLTGQAGVGKTTILYTITKKVESGRAKTRLGGNFFCSRHFAETREPQRIIPTIVYQLAQICKPYGDALYAATTSGVHPNPFDTVSLDMKIQLMSLLVIPWQQCEAMRANNEVPYLIVIDALDEMDNQGATNFLCHLFDMMNGHKLSGLKFLVASRTDPEIKNHIQAFLPRTELWLQHVLADEASADIRKHLKEHLPALGEDYHSRLEKEAGGLFIYAATAVRFICPQPRMSIKEQQLLADQLLSYSWATGLDSSEFLIDTLYRHIMVQTFSRLPVKLRMHRLKILHLLLSTRERETPATVAGIAGDDNDETARLLVEDLHSVLYLQDGRIFWYHASFPDFIFDPSRSTFRFAVQDDGIMTDYNFSCNQQTVLLHTCFDLFQSHLKFNYANIKSSFLLDAEHYEIHRGLAYVSLNWAVYLPQSGDMQGIVSRIRHFSQIQALFWIEVMNWMKKINECSGILGYVQNRLIKHGIHHSDPPKKLGEVTERDLQDRSKGDTISKGIAVLQTSWFVVQCVARAGQHLPLSKLEVLTLAFAVMNAAIYGAWWNKPQGIDMAIGIPLKRAKNSTTALMGEGASENLSRPGTANLPQPEYYRRSNDASNPTI